LASESSILPIGVIATSADFATPQQIASITSAMNQDDGYRGVINIGTPGSLIQRAVVGNNPVYRLNAQNAETNANNPSTLGHIRSPQNLNSIGNTQNNDKIRETLVESFVYYTNADGAIVALFLITRNTP